MRSNAACSAAARCSLGHAIAIAAPGDAVELAPGAYAGPISLAKPLTLRGRTDAARPVISGGTKDAATFTAAPDGTLVMPYAVAPATH